MRRSDWQKEKLEIKSEINPDNENEETAARTRPFSYDEIILRRKNKKKPAEIVAEPMDSGNISEEISKVKIPERSQSIRTYRNTKLSSIIVAKHSSEDFMTVKSQNNEDNIRKDKIIRKTGKDSRDRVIRTKPIINRDFSNKVERRMDDRRDQWNRGNRGNDYERRNSRRMPEREIYSDKNRGRPVKFFDRRPRNDDGERKSEREIKRKNRNDEEERHMKQNAIKKHDFGKRHDQASPERKIAKKISPERKSAKDVSPERKISRKVSPERKDILHKEKKEAIQSHNEESRPKKKRTRSRERDKNKFRKEEADEKRNKISNNGSSSRYRRRGGTPSGLGGYSPRKRRSEAGVNETPSPPHRSPENKKENIISNISAVPNAQSLSQNLTPKIIDLPNIIPVNSAPLRAVHGVFSYSSVDSVQLTQATRPMRRLYVENLPDSASEKTLMECLNNFLLSSGVNRVPGSQPCISCSIHKEKGQALVEFLTPEDASAALYFDGRSFSGSVLKIRRPKDYNDVATVIADKSLVAFDSSSNIVQDSPNKIFIGGVPKSMSSEMLREIAAVFGPLKAFRVEVNMDLDGPCAFLEYADQSVTLKACAGLNAMRLGGKMLTVVQATPEASSVEYFENPPFYGIPEHAKPLLQKPTQVLRLKNVLNTDGLSSLSEQELEEILEDVRLECARFGTVNSVNVAKRCEDYSIPETCKATDSAVSVKDEGMSSFEKIKSELHGEEIECESQKTSMSEVSRDDPNQNKENCKNLEHEGTSVASLDKCEMVGEKLAGEDKSSLISSDIDQNGGKINENTMTTKAKIETEEVLIKPVSGAGMDLSDEAKKDENKEIIFNYEDTFGTGSILVEYKRVEASSIAAHYLHGRFFDDRIVTVEYVDYDIYKSRFLK